MSNPDERSNTLWKSSLGFPLTNKSSEFFLETEMQYNNYVDGKDIFMDPIPASEFPDSGGTTTVYTIPRPNGTDVVNTSRTEPTGIVEKFEHLPLTLIPKSNDDGTSGAWYCKDDQGNNLLADAIQMNYNQTSEIQPYLYRLFFNGTDAPDEIYPKDGKWVFFVNFGAVKFFSTYGGIDANSDLYITFYRYVGRKGVSNINVNNITGDLSVTGNITSSGNLNSSGEVNSVGDINGTGDLIVTGNMSGYGKLEIGQIMSNIKQSFSTSSNTISGLWTGADILMGADAWADNTYSYTGGNVKIGVVGDSIVAGSSYYVSANGHFLNIPITFSSGTLKYGTSPNRYYYNTNVHFVNEWKPFIEGAGHPNPIQGSRYGAYVPEYQLNQGSHTFKIHRGYPWTIQPTIGKTYHMIPEEDGHFQKSVGSFRFQGNGSWDQAVFTGTFPSDGVWITSNATLACTDGALDVGGFLHMDGKKTIDSDWLLRLNSNNDYSGVYAKNTFHSDKIAIGFPTVALYPLHIVSSYSSGPGGSSRYFESSSNNFSSSPSLTHATSIYASHMIVSDTYVAVTSDERIKTDIEDVSDTLALEKVRNIPCRYYHYKDTLRKQDEKTIGFISQEVKEVFPQATHTITGFIPCFQTILEDYTWTERNDSSNKIVYDLTINQPLGVDGNEQSNCSGISYRFYVSNVPDGNDEKEIEVVGNSDNTFTFDSKYSNIFIWGKKVDDYLVLDKQKIYSLHHSAIQEIDRHQQADKYRINQLEQQNQQLQQQLFSVLQRLDTLEKK